MIRGDGKSSYQQVIDVLSVCKQADIQHLQLAARENSKDQP